MLSEQEITHKFTELTEGQNHQSDAILRLYELLETLKSRHDSLTERVLAIEKSNGEDGGG